MKRLLLIGLLPLSLFGCQGASEGQLTIETPSGREVVVSCPGEDEASKSLCNEALQLTSNTFPVTLKNCLESNYYSVRGSFVIDGSSKPVSYSWDCNTGEPLDSLRQAVETKAKEELGAKTGVSAYQG